MSQAIVRNTSAGFTGHNSRSCAAGRVSRQRSAGSNRRDSNFRSADTGGEGGSLRPMTMGGGGSNFHSADTGGEGSAGVES
jgi:hypothetical protein